MQIAPSPHCTRTHTHEDEPPSFITHRRNYPMITPPSPESALTPGKASSHHSEKQECCGGDEDQHTSHIPKHR